MHFSKKKTDVPSCYFHWETQFLWCTLSGGRRLGREGVGSTGGREMVVGRLRRSEVLESLIGSL